MEDADIVIYQAVTDTGRMRSVLLQYVTSGGEFIIRSGAASISVAPVPGLSDHNEVIVNSTANNASVLSSGKQISVWFDMPGSGYFFECVPRVDGELVFLSPGKCLFQQQLRSEFRYVIPANYHAVFAVIGENLQLPVKDVNRVGIGVGIPPYLQLDIGARIDGDLSLGKYLPVRVSAKMRRQQQLGSHIYAGLEFDHMIFQSETELAERLLFLRQDVYFLNRG